MSAKTIWRACNSAIERELAAAEMRIRQRKIGEKLEFERKLLRHLMDGIPDAIYFKDVNRRYIRLNAAELSLLNMDREDSAIGRCEDEFLPPERAAARRAEDEKLLATGEPLATASNASMRKMAPCYGFRKTERRFGTNPARSSVLRGSGAT